MTVSKVEILPIQPRQGLFAFANVVLNDDIYLGSIGVHRLLNGQGIRITYPTRKVGDHNIPIYHPMSKRLNREILDAIEKHAEIFLNPPQAV